MRDRSNESGQALIFVALSMAVLMGFMALAIDVGLLFRARRNMQIAADAAATAAALNYLYYGSVTTADTAAINAAAANGVTITAHNINSPPLSGPYHTTSAGAYFEVIPTQAQGTTFMGVISNTSSVNVAARAVAGTPTAGKACIYITDPTGSGVFDMQGNTTVTAPGCGIYVNSSSSSAVNITGGSTSVNAAYFNLYGPYTGKKQSPPTNPTPNSPAQSDPLGNIAGPNPVPPSTDCTAGNTVTATTVNATTGPSLPSSNGITCFSKAVTFSGGTTVPGGVIYVFENGLTIGGTMTLGSSTSGVTLDIYSGTFTQGNSNLSIFAPTSGTYNGIAIMQPASNNSLLQIQFGSGNETLDGMIYAPGAEVDLHDNGGGVTATGIVAKSMSIKSSSLTINSYSGAHPTTTPLRVVTLVE